MTIDVQYTIYLLLTKIVFCQYPLNFQLNNSNDSTKAFLVISMHTERGKYGGENGKSRIFKPFLFGRCIFAIIASKKRKEQKNVNFFSSRTHISYGCSAHFLCPITTKTNSMSGKYVRFDGEMRSDEIDT